MRTLKKTLALVLVLAMMFSLCITASADFTDEAGIENAKAVATLVNLGVIEGNPDGSFNPAGTLTRAQAAKIIACLMGVGEYAADGAATGFTDVPASHWASGYIAYCVEEGIVDGYGDGTFGPSDTLTGYAWTKMLLCALGYDSAVEGYTGSAWQIAVAKDAVTLKLWKGADADNKAGLSRDDACLYAYNVLNQTAVQATYILGEFNKYNEVGNFAETNLFVKVEEADVSYDELGKPYESVVVTDVQTDKASVAYTGAMAPVLTYTAGVKADKIKKDLGLATKDFAKASLGEFSEAGKGVLVEVYEMDDADTTTVAEYYVNTVATKIHTLEKADITAYKAATDKADEVKASIKLPGVDLPYETAAYEKGDVIIYNVGEVKAGTNAGKTVALNVAEAKAVTGTITATAADYVKVDGVKYEVAAGTATPSLGDTAVYYLDQYGYIKAAGTVTPATITTKVIGVLAEEYVAAKPGSLTAESAAPVAKLKVLDLETGVVSVVNRAVVLGDDGVYYFAGVNGKAPVDEAGKYVASAEVKTATAGDGKSITYYNYVVLEDGTYALGTTTAATADLTIKQGTATVKTGWTATSKTTLTTVTYKVNTAGVITGATVETVTGIANFPKTAETAAFVTAKDGIVSAMTIVKAAVVVADPAEYAIYAGKGETTDKTVEYKFIVDGEAVAYTASATIAELETATAGDIVSYVLKAGKLDSAAVVAGTDAVVGVVDATFFTDAAGVAHYFAADVVIVDAGAEYAVAESIAAEDAITYITGVNATTGATEVVYILIAAAE